jgi:REP element-mobilizing transposase RayT
MVDLRGRDDGASGLGPCQGGSATVSERVLSSNSAMRDFDDNEFPLAYLITFRCYGTWLHGDARGSVDPKHNVFGAPKIAANQRLENTNRKQLKNAPVVLGARQRKIVERAVRAVCDYREYVLLALNVRTNHVHCVVSAMCKPEPVLDTFKAYATRALHGAGLIGLKTKPWARHGSTVYLWKEKDVEKAIEYVTQGQGEELDDQ